MCNFRKVVVSGLLLSIPTTETYKVEGMSSYRWVNKYSFILYIQAFSI